MIVVQIISSVEIFFVTIIIFMLLNGFVFYKTRFWNINKNIITNFKIVYVRTVQYLFFFISIFLLLNISDSFDVVKMVILKEIIFSFLVVCALLLTPISIIMIIEKVINTKETRYLIGDKK